jgi:hypothetical protein
MELNDRRPWPTSIPVPLARNQSGDDKKAGGVQFLSIYNEIPDVSMVWKTFITSCFFKADILLL